MFHKIVILSAVLLTANASSGNFKKSVNERYCSEFVTDTNVALKDWTPMEQPVFSSLQILKDCVQTQSDNYDEDLIDAKRNKYITRPRFKRTLQEKALKYENDLTSTLNERMAAGKSATKASKSIETLLSFEAQVQAFEQSGKTIIEHEQFVHFVDDAVSLIKQAVKPWPEKLPGDYAPLQKAYTNWVQHLIDFLDYSKGTIKIEESDKRSFWHGLLDALKREKIVTTDLDNDPKIVTTDLDKDPVVKKFIKDEIFVKLIDPVFKDLNEKTLPLEEILKKWVRIESLFVTPYGESTVMAKVFAVGPLHFCHDGPDYCDVMVDNIHILKRDESKNKAFGYIGGFWNRLLTGNINPSRFGEILDATDYIMSNSAKPTGWIRYTPFDFYNSPNYPKNPIIKQQSSDPVNDEWKGWLTGAGEPTKLPIYGYIYGREQAGAQKSDEKYHQGASKENTKMMLNSKVTQKEPFFGPFVPKNEFEERFGFEVTSLSSWLKFLGSKDMFDIGNRVEPLKDIKDIIDDIAVFREHISFTRSKYPYLAQVELLMAGAADLLIENLQGFVKEKTLFTPDGATLDDMSKALGSLRKHLEDVQKLESKLDHIESVRSTLLDSYNAIKQSV